MKMSKKVLIIGKGGREHALAWKLSQSPEVVQVFVAPANAGIANHGGKVVSVGKLLNLFGKDFIYSVLELNVSEPKAIVDWCRSKSIDLVVVGPEDPLCNGLSDILNSNGIKCFGPSQKAAQIECDKAFAKKFMHKYNVPTARFQNFTDANQAKKYVQETKFLVVKASGLAAGKGVVVAQNVDQALNAIDDIMVKRIHGDAGNEVVVEELLEGDEVSIFAITDGTSHITLLPAQDHKRAYDGDKGPNTGGMGAFCPYPFLNSEQLERIKHEIIERTIDGLRTEGRPFVGLLYAGLILTSDGPKVIEFNCRFGDPETQSILVLLETDLYKVFDACLSNDLANITLKWKNRSAVGVVIASGGYPGTVQKNIEIQGLSDVKDEDVLVFHSGTVFRDGKYYSDGGRVLTVVALANNLEQAASKATQVASTIRIDNSFYRKDIAFKAIQKYVSVCGTKSFWF